MHLITSIAFFVLQMGNHNLSRSISLNLYIVSKCGFHWNLEYMYWNIKRTHNDINLVLKPLKNKTEHENNYIYSNEKLDKDVEKYKSKTN